jgi:hypothetical protein
MPFAQALREASYESEKERKLRPPPFSFDDSKMMWGVKFTYQTSQHIKNDLSITVPVIPFPKVRFSSTFETPFWWFCNKGDVSSEISFEYSRPVSLSYVGPDTKGIRPGVVGPDSIGLGGDIYRLGAWTRINLKCSRCVNNGCREVNNVYIEPIKFEKDIILGMAVRIKYRGRLDYIRSIVPAIRGGESVLNTWLSANVKADDLCEMFYSVSDAMRK